MYAVPASRNPAPYMNGYVHFSGGIFGRYPFTPNLGVQQELRTCRSDRPSPIVLLPRFLRSDIDESGITWQKIDVLLVQWARSFHPTVCSEVNLVEMVQSWGLGHDLTNLPSHRRADRVHFIQLRPPSRGDKRCDQTTSRSWDKKGNVLRRDRENSLAILVSSLNARNVAITLLAESWSVRSPSRCRYTSSAEFYCSISRALWGENYDKLLL